jgi:mannose-6-phosphate isomerase
MCVNGVVEVIGDNFKEIIKKGETLLLPAIIKDYKLVSENAELLEIFI